MNNILTKEFTLAEVLGAISGHLLVDKGFDRIHELIEWVVGDPVFTHQIPDVAPHVQRCLTRQFPQLNPDTDKLLARELDWIIKSLKSNDADTASRIWEMWFARFGKTFQVAPLQPFDEFIMPPLITDNIKNKVIPVAVQGDDFPDNI